MKCTLTRWNPASDPGEPRSKLVLLPESDLPWSNAVSAAYVWALLGGAVVLDPRPLSRLRRGDGAAGAVWARVCRTQTDVDALAPELLAAPAWCRALVLTLHERVDLRYYIGRHDPQDDTACADFCEGYPHRLDDVRRERWPTGHVIDWVLVLGGAEPMHPAWVRAIRDQCAAAGVPFWFDGWGLCTPEPEATGTLGREGFFTCGCPSSLLDGREHREMPIRVRERLEIGRDGARGARRC